MLYGIDFGVGTACAIWGDNGIVTKKQLKLPRVKGGKTPAMEFIMILETLLTGCEGVPPGDVAVESATIGASGCEKQDMVELLKKLSDRSVFVVSGRAVKNYRLDNKLDWHKGARYAKDGKPTPQPKALYSQAEVHTEDAQIIWTIAKYHPSRLHKWEGIPEEVKRVHTSVRPMDKRGYRDDRAIAYMQLLPPYTSLPKDLKEILGNKKGYYRPMVMPFAMATEEPYLDGGPIDDRRRRYEKVIGLGEHGYPSFYRRATVVWMQAVAKSLCDATRIAEVTPDIRKEAWRVTQKQIREFFHLTMRHLGR